MKVLTIEAAFGLPEDFVGDLPDAVVLLAEYLRANKDKQSIAGEERFFNEVVWRKFWARPEWAKCVIAAGISEPRDS